MTNSTTPYHDDAGRPRLEASIAGFIDMLGFSQMSTRETDVTASQQLLDRIAQAIADARQFARENVGADASAALAGRTAVKYFSDNLVIGAPLDVEGIGRGTIVRAVIRVVQQYQLRMALSGFFLRGALTQGQLCLTDDLIYGPTLIEAYQLESKTAIVPRVVLTEPLREAAAGLTETSAAEPGADDLICRDVDGWWFVNYLQAARGPAGIDWQVIARHKQSILTSLSGSRRHDVLPKYGWACRYHNVFCHWHRASPGYGDVYRIDRQDETSTIDRPSDLRGRPA